jgi:phosphoglycolate phosphatase
MKEYLLFDLDGTLTDSEKGITACVQYALKSFGIDETDLDKLEKFIGPPLRDSFKNFYAFTDEQAEEAVAKYRERYADTGIFENELYDGISHMLKLLKTNGLHLAVASSKPKVYVDKILKHFDIDKYFEVVVGSELDGTRDSKSEVVSEALSKLFKGKPVETDKVYMIGDTKYDVEGARKMHVECVGVSYGFGSMEELKEAKASYIVQSVGELEKFLLRDVEAEAPKTTMFQKIWAILYAFLMFMLVKNIAMYVLNWLLITVGMNMSGSWMNMVFTWNERGELSGFTGNAVTIMSAIGFIAGAVSIFGTAKLLIEKTAYDDRLLYLKPEPPISYVLMTLTTFGSVVGLNILFEISGITQKSAAYRALQEDQYSAYFIIGILCYGIVTPIAEELLFRGIIYNYLKRFLDRKWAFFLAAVLFGLYHMNMVQGVYAFIMGLVILYAYEYFGDFRAAVAVHMLSNIISYCLTYTAAAVSWVVSLPVCIIALVLGVAGMGILEKRKRTNIWK